MGSDDAQATGASRGGSPDGAARRPRSSHSTVTGADAPAGRPAKPDQPSTIQIYARVRPARRNSKLPIDPSRYWCNGSGGGPEERARIGFHIPKDQAAGMVNNQREAYDFRFDRVFDMASSQEEVFDVVAKPVVMRCVPP